MKRRLLFLFVIPITLLFVSTAGDIGDPSIPRSADNSESFSFSYTDHHPISISSNGDFETQGWPGNGTEINPYRIQNLNITNSSECITISDTTVYFEITDCLISSPSQSANDAVLWDNVTHGTIKNCIVNRHINDVYLKSCADCYVTNNTAGSAYAAAFYLSSSHDCRLANNTAVNSASGFRIVSSPNCIMIGNNASNNWNHGFYIDSSSTAMLINNTAGGNSYNGFNIQSSDFCRIENNTATGNEWNGFYMFDVNWSNFTENTASDSDPYDGFYLHTSVNATLIENIAMNNDNGFRLRSSANATLANNTATGNSGYGFYGYSSSDNCTIANNTSKGNSNHGFYFAGSKRCAFTRNWALNNTGYDGFVIGSSSNSILIKNTAKGNSRGFRLSNSGNSLLQNNNASDNSDYGFHILSSDMCSLNENYAEGNQNHGFFLDGSSGCNLTWNIASDHLGFAGFSLVSSANSRLSNNTATGNSFGFQAESSDDCVLLNNTASSNSENGFSLDSSVSCVLTDNTADTNNHGFYLYNANSSVLTNNTAFDNSDCGFCVNRTTDCLLQYDIASGNSQYGFYLLESGNCTLKGNNASENSYGFYLESCYECHFVNNIAISNDNDGLCFSNCEECDVIENIAVGNSGYGFHLISSNSSFLLGNNATGNLGHGFFLDGSNTCILDDNIAAGNSGYDGFRLSGSVNCTLKHNLAFDNENGLRIISSVGCVIENNTVISNNFRGIWLESYSTDCIMIGNKVRNHTNIGVLVIDSYNCVLIDNIANMNQQHGFYIYRDSYNCSLLNNSATGNSRFGFWLRTLVNCTVRNNTAAENLEKGIYLQASHWCNLTDNSVVRSEYGIQLSSCGNCTLQDNNLLENGFYLSGSLSQWLHNITSNTVNEKPLGYFKSINGSLIDGAPYGQLVLANCSWVTLRDGTFPNASIGVLLGYSKNCAVINNTAFSNVIGFYIVHSNNCSFMDNRASNSLEHGFHLRISGKSNLTNNIANNNSENGFYLDDSKNCMLQNNTAISNALRGIWLYYSGNSILTSNTASKNSEAGIWLYHSWGCNVTNNLVLGNPCGIALTETLYARIFLNSIGYSSVYNAIDNYWGSGTLSEWDNGTHGNYWSDYNGYGVYHIEGLSNNVDNYPAIYEGEPPVIDQPCDIQYLLGSTNNTITWNPWDWDPTRYEVFLNETLLVSELWNGSGISFNVDALDVGVFSFTLTVYDSRAHYVSDTVLVTVIELTAPSLDHPSNVEYELSSTGNSIAWSTSDGYPYWCTVYRNGSIVHSSSWDGSDILLGIDGLDLGVYNFTIVVCDSSGNTASDMVLVLVTDTTLPEIEHPDDIEYELGVPGNSITWNVSDLCPDSYEVYRNGSLVSSGFWGESDIIANVDGLALGTYNYTLIVSDTSGNTANDMVLVTVVDTTPPSIDHPSDTEYELGTTGNVVTWEPNDLEPSAYEVYHNGDYLQSDSWDGSTIDVNIDGLDLGTHNITIVVYDISSNSISDSVIVTVIESVPPSIDSPVDTEYELGSIGHTLTWNASDAHPDSYEVYRNGTLVDSGTWNGSAIIVDVTGLPLAIYNYTIVVFDTCGNRAADMVFVKVTDTTSPTVDSPDNITYEIGTQGHSITWSPSDLAPDSYKLYRNGTLATLGSWTGGDISVDIDGLGVASYNFTVVLYDGGGNMVSDAVWVFVIPAAATTPTTTTGVQGPSPMIIAIGVGGAAGAIVIILVAIYVKKPEWLRR